MTVQQVQVKRKAFSEYRLVEQAEPKLKDGEVLARIDKFALTANNVTYALSGDMIGYWKFFPADEPWGIVPVWGFADIVASRCPDVPVGERIWGFLPTATHVVLAPTQVSSRAFVDGASHRAQLPPIYNAYQRTSADAPEMKALEDARCILFPLFSTSFLLDDYLADNAFFGAQQVLVGSASSKTGFGLCNLLHRRSQPRPRVVGLTSPKNVSFVERRGVCDEVVTYDQIATRDAAVPTAFVDMSGDGSVISAIHQCFGSNLKLSCAVGATHWTAERFRGEGAAVPHEFFFAPGQFLKREKEWGPGEPMRRAARESARMAGELAGLMRIDHVSGPEAVARVFNDLVANRIAPDVGVIARV